jgi:hypothetical protein
MKAIAEAIAAIGFRRLNEGRDTQVKSVPYSIEQPWMTRIRCLA